MRSTSVRISSSQSRACVASCARSWRNASWSTSAGASEEPPLAETAAVFVTRDTGAGAGSSSVSGGIEMDASGLLTSQPYRTTGGPRIPAMGYGTAPRALRPGARDR